MGGRGARPPVEPASGVRAGPAQVETLDRRTVSGAACGRTAEEDLIERHLAVVDVSLGQREAGGEVGRRQHVPVQDCRFEVGDVLRQRRDDRASQRRAALVIP